MKRVFLLVAALFMAVTVMAQKPYWQEVSTVAVNRVAPRAEFVTFADKSMAKVGDFSASENYQLLNGTWKFLYFDA
jgi:beta-galactosidase